MNKISHQRRPATGTFCAGALVLTVITRLLSIVLIAGLYVRPVLADGTPTHAGDIVVAVSNGYGYSWDNQIKYFSPDGRLRGSIDFGNSNNSLVSFGFDSSHSLYVVISGGTENNVIKLNRNGIEGSFGSGYLNPLSIVFDNHNNVYVGEGPYLTNDPARILKFDSDGNPLATYAAQIDPTSGFGVGSAYLTSDQCTLRYTAGGRSIKQYDVCSGTQLPDFVTFIQDPYGADPPYELLYSIQGLDNGNILVGTWDRAFLLNSRGGIIRDYAVPGTALSNIALAPGQKSFWALDWIYGNVYQFDIKTGAVMSQFHVAGSSGLAYTLAVVPGSVADGNLGKQCTCTGDPINTVNGNAYEDENDISLGALSFHRYYNSRGTVEPAHMGAHWRDSFDRSIQYSASENQAIAFRPDGKQFIFILKSGQWVADADVADHLVTQTDSSGAITGWSYFDANTRHRESYDADGNLRSITNIAGQVTALTYSTTATPSSVAPQAGLLLTVTGPRGRTLNFSYNANAQVDSIREPDGGKLAYAYDANGNLISVTYPDQTSRQYRYNESQPSDLDSASLLTGVVDETGTRYTSIDYNSQGQATMSMLASGVDKTQIAYNPDGTTTVTYPTGAQTTLGFTSPYNTARTSSVSAPCGVLCGQRYAAVTYDANGYPASATSFNGNVTETTYDVHGLLTQKIEAQGQPDQRTTNTLWNPDLRVPLKRTISNAAGNLVGETEWVYNTKGQVLARCKVDSTRAASYACATSGAVPAGIRRWIYLLRHRRKLHVPAVRLVTDFDRPAHRSDANHPICLLRLQQRCWLRHARCSLLPIR